jgi:hypothetical protein
VAFVSEYSEEIDCFKQTSRYHYQTNSFLLISERAVVFQKTNICYAKNIIFYSLPESVDILNLLAKALNKDAGFKLQEIMEGRENRRLAKEVENGRKIYKTRREEKDALAIELTEAERKEEREIARAKIIEGDGLLFTLFSKFDELKLERVVGKKLAVKMLKDDVKETWSVN